MSAEAAMEMAQESADAIGRALDAQKGALDCAVIDGEPRSDGAEPNGTEGTAEREAAIVSGRRFGMRGLLPLLASVMAGDGAPSGGPAASVIGYGKHWKGQRVTRQVAKRQREANRRRRKLVKRAKARCRRMAAC